MMICFRWTLKGAASGTFTCIYAIFIGLASISLTPIPNAHAENEQLSALREPPVTIGGIFCLTGEIASGCNAIREGAEVAADVINKSGGIQGRPLRLDIQDSHYVPRDANTLAQRFANNDEVLGVLITGIVETKSAAFPLERARMSYITLWDSAPAIEALGDYSYGIGPWMPATYELSAEFAFYRLKARRTAVIATTAEWSLGVAQGFRDKFKELGGEISAYEETVPNEADFRSVLNRLLATKPNAIYAPVTAHIIPVFRQLRQLGFTGPIITSDDLTEDLIEQGKGIFEGTFQTMVIDPHNTESDNLILAARPTI